MSFKYFLAASFAIDAALRLVFWRRHEKRDLEWLNRKFGESPENAGIAKDGGLLVAAAMAIAGAASLLA